jgi:hypothetical protein
MDDGKRAHHFSASGGFVAPAFTGAKVGAIRGGSLRTAVGAGGRVGPLFMQG